MNRLKKFILALCLAVATFQVIASGKININTADAKAIASLKGIGTARAKAIVEYRNQHGPFKSIDALTDVKGVGKKIVEENRNSITVDGK